MKRPQIVVSTALVGVLGLGVGVVTESVQESLGNALLAGTAPVWLPTLGTPGRTALIYTSLLESIRPVLVLVLGLVVGYALASSYDVSSEFNLLGRTVLGGYALGGVVGFVVFGAVHTALFSSGAGGSLWLDPIILALLTRLLAGVVLTLTIATMAGAALAYFNTERDSHTRPDGAPPPSPQDGARTSAPEEPTQPIR